MCSPNSEFGHFMCQPVDSKIVNSIPFVNVKDYPIIDVDYNNITKIPPKSK